jgi:hypothetical protein
MSGDLSARKVRNPWPDLCTVDGDPDGLMGARTLIVAMQWGAPSGRLTPEARQLLEDYFACNRIDAQDRVNTDGSTQ